VSGGPLASAPTSRGDGDGPARSGRDQDRWHLRDERDFLRRSLDDADREHRAGDLSDADHAVLVARDSARLADVEAALAALVPGPAPVTRREEATHGEGPPREGRRPMRWWRGAGIVAACACIVAGGAILVTHFVQSRQPGQASSGSVTLSQAQTIEQQLDQALSLNNEGNTGGALELYDKVLSQDPTNPAALAHAGFIQWNIGSSRHVAALVRIGRAEIETAVRNSPSYGDAHLYDGLVLVNQDHDDAAAVTQFDDYLAAGPAPSELAEAAPLVAGAYTAVGKPVPASVLQALPTTTTTTSAP
jgi:hypothetical protein